MDFLILAIAIVLLSVFLGVGLLIVFINFGVFPRPEADDFARRLYWRKEIRVEHPVQTATAGSMIAAPTEWTEFRSATDRALFLGEKLRGMNFGVFPNVTDVTAAGEKVLIRAA